MDIRELLGVLVSGVGGAADMYGTIEQKKILNEDDLASQLAKMKVAQILEQSAPDYQVDIDYKKALTQRALREPIGGGYSFNDELLSILKKGRAEKERQLGRPLTYQEDLELVNLLTESKSRDAKEDPIMQLLKGAGTQGTSEPYPVGTVMDSPKGKVRYIGNNQWELVD